jgi:PIN domain nuclease of toxin-antitoxin system
MSFLIDTHTFLWASTAPEKLFKVEDGVLSDPNSTILVSVVVPWELAIKTNSGNLQAAKLLTDIEERVLRMGFFMQGVQTSEVIRSGLLPFHHRDPFDRLLAAQSLELDIPLISRDAVFDQYGVKRIS